MKKMLGIMAVVALFASPSLAAEAESQVTITVEPYGSIGEIPPLALTVTGPWLNGAGSPSAVGSTNFVVLCNTASTLKLTAAVTTASAPPGMGYLYPTAIGSDGEAAGPPAHRMGFGLTLCDIGPTPERVPWPDTTDPDDAYVEVTFSRADIPANYLGGPANARIEIVSYTDSARDGDKLAPPGEYSTILTLTLLPTV